MFVLGQDGREIAIAAEAPQIATDPPVKQRQNASRGPARRAPSKAEKGS